jgi:MFS family permease
MYLFINKFFTYYLNHMIILIKTLMSLPAAPDTQFSQLEISQSSSRTTSTNINDFQMLARTTPLLDELIDKRGYRLYHFKSIALSCLLSIIEGIHIVLSGVVLYLVKSTYNLDIWQATISTGLLFVAMGIGSLASTCFSIESRRKPILICVFVIILATMLCALENIIIFISLRTLTGFCLGVIFPLNNNYLCETLPAAWRSFWLFFIIGFSSFGSIFSFFIMSVYSTNLTIPLFFLFISVPIVIIWILLFIFYEDSFRYSFSRKKYEEGFETLEKSLKMKIPTEQRDIIIKQFNEGGNKRTVSIGLKSVISKEYKKVTFLLICLWAIYSLIINGGMFNLFIGTPESQPNEVNANNARYLNRQDGVFVMGFYFIYFIGNLIGGCISEIHFLGRRRTIMLAFFFVFTMCAVAVFWKFFIPLNILSFFFVHICMAALNSYSSEIYPTRLRDTAIGFFYFINRMFGFIAHLITLLFQDYYRFSIHQEITAFALSVIGFILSYYLPFDTVQRPLDIKVPQRKEEVNLVDNEDLTRDKTNLSEEIIDDSQK